LPLYDRPVSLFNIHLWDAMYSTPCTMPKGYHTMQ
jgi:hypothetical protein